MKMSSTIRGVLMKMSGIATEVLFSVRLTFFFDISFFLRIFTSNSDIFNQIKKDETDPMPK